MRTVRMEIRDFGNVQICRNEIFCKQWNNGDNREQQYNKDDNIDKTHDVQFACCERCVLDERAVHGLQQLECCGAAHGAERVQRWRASGAHGVWVCGRARVDWHGGRQCLRGVSVGV